MRKLTAILLTILFGFSQYARQLSYLECQISNTFKVKTAKCDCEKKKGIEKKDASQSPLQQTHTHIHLDEFFARAGEVVMDPNSNIIISTSNGNPAYDECEGNGTQPWQPPNA